MSGFPTAAPGMTLSLDARGRRGPAGVEVSARGRDSVAPTISGARA